MTPIDVQVTWLKVKVKLLAVDQYLLNLKIARLLQWMPPENRCFLNFEQEGHLCFSYISCLDFFYW